MLRPDLAIRPAAAAPAAAPTTPTAPLRAMPSSFASSGGMFSADFSATFGALQSDVADFIENGSRSGGQGDETPMSALSVEGSVYRNSVQAAQAEGTVGSEQQEFLSSITPWAQETGKRLGVSPDIVAAHAALESGWGKRPLKQADGVDTHNLFGLKAGGKWHGDVAQAVTTEYEDGSAVPKVERFRSYPDRASAFRDYAQLLATNPRYRAALNAGGDARAFAQGLAQGGYATDPAYAEKLARVATRIQSAQSAQSEE
jgi:flagellar protein FlgJ